MSQRVNDASKEIALLKPELDEEGQKEIISAHNLEEVNKIAAKSFSRRARSCNMIVLLLASQLSCGIKEEFPEQYEKMTGVHLTTEDDLRNEISRIDRLFQYWDSKAKHCEFKSKKAKGKSSM